MSYYDATTNPAAAGETPPQGSAVDPSQGGTTKLPPGQNPPLPAGAGPAPAAIPGDPASLQRALQVMELYKQLAPAHKFTPVEYDPFGGKGPVQAPKLVPAQIPLPGAPTNDLGGQANVPA